MHRSLRSMIAAVTVLVAIAALAPTARAQGVTGSAVAGTITEEGGKPLEGALVELRNEATGDAFNGLTDAEGKYFLDNVTSGGPYVFTALVPGYELLKRANIQLQLGQRLKLDVQMRIQVEEIVVVEHSDAVGDRGRTGASTTVREGAIARLPLQGRNFTDLVSTSPQANGSSIGGQNNRYNNIQIDGGANNDLFGLSGSGTPGGQANAKPISIEAIKEFVIQVAPFDVRQGSFTGGLINAITRSGTNEFHGGVFTYFQNKALAGRQDDPAFLNYSTWQFGAAVGGPIIKDKLHFFVATDIQQRQSAFGNNFQIGGTDSEADIAKAGFDRATAERFADILVNKYGYKDPGTALPPDLANPDRNVFVKLSTSLIPDSHLELTYNFVSASQDTIIRSPTATTIPGRLRDGYELSNSGYSQTNGTHTGRVKMTSNWSGGKLSNEFLAGFSIVSDERAVPSNAPLVFVKVGKIGSSDSWLAAGAERFSQANSLDQNIYQFQDNMTFALGEHRLTVGTSNEFLKIRNAFLQAATGVWAFDSLDALEAGTPSVFQRRFGVSDLQAAGTSEFNVAQLGFYIQDEWALGDRLKLTPGIRMDVPFLSAANTNPTLRDNTAFPIDTGKVPSGNVLWSPRIGFNWDVDGSNDTVIRGGAGIFSGRPPYVWLSNAYSINGLSQVELTCTSATMVPAFSPDPKAQPSSCSGASGTPMAPTNAGEIDFFDPDTKYPQNARVALGADRRLPWGLVATVDFLYTEDINAWYVNDENLKYVGRNGEGRALYGTFGASGFSASPSRVDSKNLTQAMKVYNKDGGRVFSLTEQLQKKFFDMVDASIAYTYSNARDRMSLTSSQALSNFQFAPLDGDIDDRELRPSAFDRPHKITLTATANLPYGIGVGLSYVGQSGLPYTWTVNGDVDADGINGNDLVYVPAAPKDISLMDPTQWEGLESFINSQDCLREAKGRFIERGACRNPWQNLVNMRLSWTSPKVYGQSFEVQLDVFNLMNLLNSDWGHLDSAAQFENHGTAFLRAVGYDTQGRRPIYSFTAPTDVVTTVYSPTSSRWRIQLGARYAF